MIISGFIQKCRDNSTPDLAKCPAPADGCKYTYYNKESSWCQLADDSCTMTNTDAIRVIIDVKPGSDTIGMIIVYKVMIIAITCK